ncbi:MAG: OmpA family protein [Campylobacterota bacterium]|nr:OmpA family protein [Campylobacterota bacterium]
MNDYESLKELLLHDETQTIRALEKELSVLLKETQDPDLIIKRLKPVIADLLTQTIANSSDDIAKAMAPIMGDAIKEQVRTQKETIVDALYPVMGNMIAKFVSGALKETIDEINAKVQNNFSLEALQRKIKAKLKGVSESELLLQESELGNIETVFLIHTASGLMLWQGSRHDEVLNEAEMLSAMLSAIRSFVNEWIAKSDDAFELSTIDYGDSKIYLEVSGSCYLAVVVHGEIRAKMQERIRAALSDVTQAHSDAISGFNGDSATIDQDAIASRLEKLFDLEEAMPKATPISKGVKIFFFISFIVALIGVIYFYYMQHVQEHKEEIIKDRFYRTPELNLYKIDVHVDGDRLTLRGVLPYERLKHLSQTIVEDEGLDLTIDNEIVLTRILDTPEAIDEKRALLDSVYNVQDDVVLASQYDKGLIVLKGVLVNTRKKSEIIENYAKLVGAENIVSLLGIKPSRIDLNIHFDTAYSSLQGSQKEMLETLVEDFELKRISHLYPGYTLHLNSYTDGIGDVKRNHVYATQRAENIQSYLSELGVDRNDLHVNIMGRSPKDYNASIDDSRQARVVQLRWVHSDDL